MMKLLLQRSSLHFAGLLFAKAVGTLVFILLARLLTPHIFGEIAYYITLISLITILSDFGLNQWYQKQLAENSKKVLLSKLLAARIVLLVISMLFVAVYAWSFSRYNWLLSSLLLITLVPEALLSIFDGYYLAEKKPLPISLKQLVRSLFLLLGGLIFGSNLIIEWVAILILISAVLNVIWFVPFGKIAIRANHWRQSPLILRQSLSYAVLITTSYAYSRGDSIVIQKSLGSATLGWYSAAYRYLDGLSMVPTALAQNLFHIAAREGAITKQQLLRITAALFVLGLGSMFALIVLAEFLTTTLLGPAYSPAAELVRMLGIVSFLFFCNAPLGAVVQSSRFLPRFVPWGIANTALNIGLNILLVPRYGVLAAAYVMMGTELLGFVINVYFVRKIYPRTIDAKKQ